MIRFTRKKTRELFPKLLLIFTLFLSACSLLENAGIQTTATSQKDVDTSSKLTPDTGNREQADLISSAVVDTVTTLAAPTKTTVTTEPVSEIKKLTLWVPPQFDPTQDSIPGSNLAYFIEKFTSEHPNTEISIRVKDTAGEGSVLNALSAAKNAAPDVVPSLILLSRSDMETAMQRGLIQSISTDIFTESASWFNYARQSSTIDNTVYGIPVAGDGLVLAYRSQKLGADLLDWTDILGRGMPIAFAPSNPSSVFASYIYRSLGGKMTNDQGQIALDQEHLNGMLNFFLSGGKNGVFPPSLSQIQDDSQSWQRFTEGSLNLIVSTFSAYKHYQTPEIKAIALPRNDERDDYPMVTSWNLVLTETEPVLQRIAVEFAEFMASEAVNGEWTLNEGYLPVRNNEQTIWQSDSQYDTMITICDRGTLIPGNQVLNKIFPVINDAVLQVIKNAMTPDQAAQYAIDALN